MNQPHINEKLFNETFSSVLPNTKKWQFWNDIRKVIRKILWDNWINTKSITNEINYDDLYKKLKKWLNFRDSSLICRECTNFLKVNYLKSKFYEIFDKFWLNREKKLYDNIDALLVYLRSLYDIEDITTKSTKEQFEEEYEKISEMIDEEKWVFDSLSEECKKNIKKFLYSMLIEYKDVEEIYEDFFWVKTIWYYFKYNYVR